MRAGRPALTEAQASSLAALRPKTRVVTLIDRASHLAGVCEHAAWVCSRLRGDIQLVGVDPSPMNATGPMLAEASEDGAAALSPTLGEALLRLEEMGAEPSGLFRARGSLVAAARQMSQDAAIVVVGKRERTQSDCSALAPFVLPLLRGIEVPVLLASQVFLPIERVLIVRPRGPEKANWPAGLIAGLDVEFASVGAGALCGETPTAEARLSGDCYDLILAPRTLPLGETDFAEQLAARRCSLLIY
ncbi:MAG TPA: hypothetical protein VF138_11285 [Caulobacteraceae bacterium]